MPSNLRNVESRAADIVLDTTAEWSTSFQQISSSSSESESETSGSSKAQTIFPPKVLNATSESSDFVGFQNFFFNLSTVPLF